MITETIVYTCDECGAVEAVQEIRYGLMGKEFALDMCNSCYAIWNNLMAPYVAKSRSVKYTSSGIRRDANHHQRKKATPPNFTAIPTDPATIPGKKRRAKEPAN